MFTERKVHAALFLVVFFSQISSSAELHVSIKGNDGNDGSAAKPFLTISAAVRAARSGDVITVHPKPDNKPYEKTAAGINQARITIRADILPGGSRIPLGGKGFDYSGRGSIPRAVIQFNKGADDCVIEGFELSGAHNESHNGAGIRINQANGVTVRNCTIHGNDMGVMSNGDGTRNTAAGQMFMNCLIYSNGDPVEPGYNHNLYLGGTSATLIGCEVHSSLTGHNVKSRCHQTTVVACYIHDSANREFDLVDAVDTAQPGSSAVLAGNVIAKSSSCKGNRQVIHFGQDGGKEHDGVLYLVHNTISTPFISPVAFITASKARVVAINNLVWDAGSGQGGMQFVQAEKGIDAGKAVTGNGNWFSSGFGGNSLAVLPLTKSAIAPPHRDPPFAAADKGDFKLTRPDAGITGTDNKLPVELVKITGGKLMQYKTPQRAVERPIEGKADVGAYALERK